MQKVFDFFCSCLIFSYYLLILSVAESALINPLAIPIAVWMGYLMNQKKYYEVNIGKRHVNRQKFYNVKTYARKNRDERRDCYSSYSNL